MPDNVISENQLQYIPALCDALKHNFALVRSLTYATSQPPEIVYDFHEVEALASARELFDQLGELLGIKVDEPPKKTKGTMK